MKSFHSPQPFAPRADIYIILQGSGMQQHSYPSHSRHLVFPGSLPAGLMIEEALEEGSTKLTGVEVAVEEHMFEVVLKVDAVV